MVLNFKICLLLHIIISVLTTKGGFFFDNLFRIFGLLRNVSFHTNFVFEYLSKGSGSSRNYNLSLSARVTSSDGRAPDLHSGGTGIDAPVIHFYFS